MARPSSSTRPRKNRPNLPEGTLIPLCLFFFFIATNTQSGWLYVLLAFLLGLLGMGFFGPRRTIRGLQVERQVRSGFPAGESTSVRLEIRNPSRQARHYLTVKDRLVTNLSQPEHEQWVSLPIDLLPAESVQVVEYSLPCPMRGVYQFASAWIESATPVGLFAAVRAYPAAGTVVVFPKGPHLTRLPMHQAVPLSVVPLQVNHVSGQSHDFAGIREYLPGEDIRFIHWPSTARTGDLMVKEFLDQSSQSVVVLLDCDRGAGAMLEEAVSAAAAMSEAARRSNLALTLLASQGEEVKAVRHPHAEQHLYFLAGVQANATLSWERLVRLAVPHCPARAQLFVLTCRPTLRPEHLTELAGKRLHVSALFFTPPAEAAAAALREARVPTYVLSQADDLPQVFQSSLVH